MIDATRRDRRRQARPTSLVPALEDRPSRQRSFQRSIWVATPDSVFHWAWVS